MSISIAITISIENLKTKGFNEYDLFPFGKI
jgi:hypothetical protein